MSGTTDSQKTPYFIIETKLEELFKCIDEVHRALRDAGLPKNKSKRLKLTHAHQRSIATFKTKMGCLKMRWSTIVKGGAGAKSIFELLSTDRMYDEIAQHLVDIFESSRAMFVHEDENWKVVLESILYPIIASILDESEVSEESQERQRRRRYFVQRLCDSLPKIRQSKSTTRVRERSTSRDSELSIIDVCAATQDPSCGETNRESSNSESTADGVEQCPLPFSWITMKLLEILVEALDRHSKAVSAEDVNYFAELYHIMNISYVVDILGQQLGKIKRNLQNNPQILQDQDKQEEVTLFIDAWFRFEASLSADYELFDALSPLVIFRNDLRTLLIQLRTFRPLLSK